MNELRIESLGQNTVNPPSRFSLNVDSAPEDFNRSANDLQPCFAIRTVKLSWDDVIRVFFDRFDKRGAEFSTIVYGSETHFPAFEIGDVDVAGGAGSFAGGLEHGGGEGGTFGDLVELFGAEVVGEDVEREDVFDCIESEVFGEEVGHGGVVDGAYGDGGAAVDLGGEVGDGEVVVEGGEVGVLGEDAGDVVGVSGGGGEEEREEERES
ncbi:unnamed protein product [Camellia sinensis]